MSCLGVHFALTEAEVEKLRAFTDQDDRLDYVQEEIEEQYLDAKDGFAAESDAAWDAMHRVFCGGELIWHGSDYPLSHVVIVGEQLYDEDDYIMSLKSPIQVQDIAAALPAVTEADFRTRYFAIDPVSYGFEVNEDDFAYTWQWFQEVRDLYVNAAAANRYVLFTADQ
jgi:hypothetical protein